MRGPMLPRKRVSPNRPTPLTRSPLTPTGGKRQRLPVNTLGGQTPAC
jgi:hypothetical protein